MSPKHRKARDSRPAKPSSAAVAVADAKSVGLPGPPPDSARTQGAWWTLALAVLLIALNLAVFAPVRHYDFVQLDDPVQVSENQHVAGGLTWDGVQWAFTSAHAGYWMPLVWLSHMADVQLYGMNAGPHHVTNLLLHIANTLLLFGLLRRLTGSIGPSGFVAALFAVHPLHVESVAWITERKDVLSTLFWMLTMWAYVAWTRRPGAVRYAMLLAAFALGLMAKPMLVTLPFALLLMDVWPLGRLRYGGSREQGSGIRDQGSRIGDQGSGIRVRGAAVHDGREAGGERRGAEGGRRETKGVPALFFEKLPLFVVAVAAAVVAFLTQRGAGAVSDLQEFPLALRVQNALVSYIAYLGKMVWPVRLVPFYSFPDAVPFPSVVTAVALLAFISFAVVRLGRRYPYLPVGWLWYVGTLVPVIGLVQVGLQGMADRFTYVPLVGIFVMIAWGVPDLARRIGAPGRKVAIAAAAAIVVGACAVTAAAQVRHWQDSVAMWTRTTEVTLNTDAYHAHIALGRTLRAQGRIGEALGHFSEAVHLQPGSSEAQYELGSTLASQGREDEAIARLTEAVRLRSDFAEAHVDLGLLLSHRQKLDEAIAHYRHALRTKPDLPEAQNNLGALLAQQGNLQEALPHFAEAVRLKPGFENARVNLALALAATGKPQEALAQFQEALRINPANELARRAVQELSGPSRQ